MAREARSRATIRDVAELAGVDRAVVSKIVNADRRLSVRPETRQRVLDAVSALGYQPNPLARGLATSRASAFGLIVPDFRNGVYSRIIEGAQDAALSRGCALLTGSVNSSGSAAERFAKVLGNGTIDGLLVAGAADPSELAELVRGYGKPVLFVNRRVESENRHIVLDDEGAAAKAVEHLVELGHRQIGHIAGPIGSDTAERRLRGYHTALEAHGEASNPAWIVRADYTPGGGFRSMTELLSIRPRPTAVLVANVASAFGSLRAVHSAGLRTPEDVSIVSIHDDERAEFASPPLTVVRMPLYQLGVRGVDVLAQCPADAEVREVVHEPLELVVRESTAPPCGEPEKSR